MTNYTYNQLPMLRKKEKALEKPPHTAARRKEELRLEAIIRRLTSPGSGGKASG